MPIFGICLGHQMLALAARRQDDARCTRGHRGANHPVKDLTDRQGRDHQPEPRLRSMPESLPENVEVTHVTLFDGTNEGLR